MQQILNIEFYPRIKSDFLIFYKKDEDNSTILITILILKDIQL